MNITALQCTQLEGARLHAFEHHCELIVDRAPQGSESTGQVDHRHACGHEFRIHAGSVSCRTHTHALDVGPSYRPRRQPGEYK